MWRLLNWYCVKISTLYGSYKASKFNIENWDHWMLSIAMSCTFSVYHLTDCCVNHFQMEPDIMLTWPKREQAKSGPAPIAKYTRFLPQCVAISLSLQWASEVAMLPAQNLKNDVACMCEGRPLCVEYSFHSRIKSMGTASAVLRMTGWLDGPMILLVLSCFVKACNYWSSADIACNHTFTGAFELGITIQTSILKSM